MSMLFKNEERGIEEKEKGKKREERGYLRKHITKPVH
jgi:hypothetical protein